MATSTKRPDFVDRGVKQPSPGTRSVYVVLRIVVPLASYILLATPVLPRILTWLHIQSIEPSTPLTSLGQLYLTLASPLLLRHPVSFAALGLSIPRTLLLAGSLLAAAKQIHWALVLQQESLSLYNAAYVPLVNAVPELVQALLYFARRTSTAGTGETVTGPIAAGATLFAAGIVIEWLAEIQRNRFKSDPRNEGKVFKAGLFALARHVNFAGFIAWKSAGMYMSAGWIAGFGTTLFFVFFFEKTAIPPLDAYCQERYKEQWSRYKLEVPNRLVPRLW